ncbi:MAG: TolC family protein, partial [Calditrichaeota bacterium]|nr:TolC family protein [Calditrichota bacterium]
MNYKMIFLTLLIWPVMAQEKLPDILSDGRITVREAVQSALQHNPDLKIAVAAHREAAAEVWASSGLVSPTLSFTREGIDRDNSAVFNEQRWGLSQPLPSPFSAFTRVRGARAQSAARGNEREQVRLNLMRDTKKAYATLSYALMQHNLAKERVEIARELLDAARARVEAGEASGLELMKTEVQLAAAENDLTDRQIRVDEARYRLFNQMGISPGEEGYHLEFPDTLHFFPVTFEEDAVLDGLKQMPRLLAAANRQNAARWDNRTAWSSALLPDLEVSLFRQDFGSGYDYYGFEAGVKIPLWFWLNDQGKIRASRAVLHRRNGE